MSRVAWTSSKRANFEFGLVELAGESGDLVGQIVGRGGAGTVGEGVERGDNAILELIEATGEAVDGSHGREPVESGLDAPREGVELVIGDGCGLRRGRVGKACGGGHQRHGR